MKLIKKLQSKKWGANALALCIAAAFYVFLTHLETVSHVFSVLFGYMSPILLGLVFTFIVNPLVTLLETTIFSKMRSRKGAHLIAVAISVILVLLLVTGLLIILIPEIVRSIMEVVRNLDSYGTEARTLFTELQAFATEHNVDISGLTGMANNLVGDLTSTLQTNFNTIINTSVNIGVAIFNIVVGVIMSVYFLAGRDRILKGLDRIRYLTMTEEQYHTSSQFWSKCSQILTRYVVGDLLDALIVGTANFFYMTIASIPYAALISVVVGITNLAPTFGPIVGAIVGAVLLVFINPWHALWFLIFTLVIQTVDGYILKPKLFGNTLGVSSVWILITIILGGRVFGVAGVLLAIPFAAIIDYIYDNWTAAIERQREQQKTASKEVSGTSSDR